MLKDVFDKIKKDIEDSIYDFLDFSRVNIEEIENFCNKNFFYENIVIIALGASCLNIAALSAFLKINKKKVIYLNNLDEDYINEKINSLNKAITIFFAISKSGNTNETHLISRYLLNELKISVKNFFFIGPAQNSLLRELATETKANFIQHNVKTSGRFNIFSDMSLLPACLLGVNIRSLKKVFISTLDNILNNKNISQNLLEEAFWYIENYEMQRKILVMFSYCRKQDLICMWKQQILGESLGKENFGITPILAKGTFDEHTQLQLYLEGPNDKFYQIYFPKKNLLNINSYLEEENIKHANNIYFALEKAKRPIKIKQIISEDLYIDTAKQILDILLISMIIAYHKNLNPFNQPAIDANKKEILK